MAQFDRRPAVYGTSIFIGLPRGVARPLVPHDSAAWATVAEAPPPPATETTLVGGPSRNPPGAAGGGQGPPVQRHRERDDGDQGIAGDNKDLL